MHDLLRSLSVADYEFLVGLIESNVNLTQDVKLRSLLDDVVAVGGDRTRDALARQLDREIRYLGSADAAYVLRYLFGRDPAVSFRTVILDVASKLEVDLPSLSSERALLEELVKRYASLQFAHMQPDEQQAMLRDLGVGREQAVAFIRNGATVFTVPTAIQLVDTFVVNGLIKKLVFGGIGSIIGRRRAEQLFGLMAQRFPWWIRWIGPLSWTASIGWALLEVQGPAYRKTVPIVLYLGLCSLRLRDEADTPHPPA